MLKSWISIQLIISSWLCMEQMLLTKTTESSSPPEQKCKLRRPMFTNKNLVKGSNGSNNTNFTFTAFWKRLIPYSITHYPFMFFDRYWFYIKDFQNNQLHVRGEILISYSRCKKISRILLDARLLLIIVRILIE